MNNNVEKKGDGLLQRLFRPLLWSVLSAVIIYGGIIVFSDIAGVSLSIVRLGMVGWLIVLGLSLVNYGLRFLRWEIYLHRLSSRVPILTSLAYYLGGFAFTTTPGKAGEAVRSLYLKRHGVAYVHSLAAFFTERFVDLVAMVLLALFATLTFPEYQRPVLIITLSIIAMLPLVHMKSFHVFLDRQFRRQPSDKVRSTGLRLLSLLGSASALLKSGPLYAGVVLAFIAWGAEGVALGVILDALDVDASLGLAVGIYSVSVLAGALSFIPGGLGSTEAVMILLLKLVGADMQTAVAATLICRLATLWFAVMIGAAVLIVLEFGNRSTHKQVRNV